MKLHMVLISTLIGIVTTAQAIASDQLTSKQVEQAVSKFGKAFSVADIGKLDAMLCSSYTHVNGGSGNVINRDSWLNWMKSRQALVASGDFKTNHYEVSDLKIAMADQFAVVTGIVKAEVTEKGKVKSSHLRFSNVWRVEDGKLCRAAFHDSNIPEK